MANIVIRADSGRPLTNSEVDNNFANLNTDIVSAVTTSDEAKVLAQQALDAPGAEVQGVAIAMSIALG